MTLTRIDSAFLDLDALGGIDFDVQSGTPTFSVDATNHKVGIGTASPGMLLHVKGSAQNLVKWESSNSDGPLIHYYTEATQLGNIGNSKGAMSSTSAHFGISSKSDLLFGTKPSNGTSTVERLRIDSGGKLLIGHTVSRDIFKETRVQVSGANGDEAGLSIYSTEDGAAGPNLILGHSKNGEAVEDDYILGDITFTGHDGVDINSRGPVIRAKLNANAAANHLPADLIFYTNQVIDSNDAYQGYPSESLRINSAGQMILGTASNLGSVPPKFTIANNTNSSTFSECQLLRLNGPSGVGERGGIGFHYAQSLDYGEKPAAFIGIETADAGGAQKSHIIFATRNVTTDTEPTERLRITSDGNLLVNTTTSRSVMDHVGNGPTPKIQIEATNSSAIMSIISAGTADANRCGSINLGRHRNGTVGDTPTIVQDGDALGAVIFSGGDGGDMLTGGAKIHAEVDGSPGADNMPGALVFSTNPGGQGHLNNTEKLRITSAGIVRVPDNGKFTAGAGDDLQIYHSGTHNFIDAAGSADLYVRGANILFQDHVNSNRNWLIGLANGTLELYHSGNKKLETTSTGVSVTGLLSATTKSFIINHPTKEGMKLRHGSLEGPENGVYVRGRSCLEVINLPDYWTALVDPDSITVSLTPIGPSGPPRVERIENNKVYVFSEDSRPLDYFYMVNAERVDVEPLEVEIPE